VDIKNASSFEKLIIKKYGHSFNTLGLLTIPTLLFTLFIAFLAWLVPHNLKFWFVVWCVCGMVQAVGVGYARKLRFKYNYFDNNL
jgi:hypothetical protein